MKFAAVKNVLNLIDSQSIISNKVVVISQTFLLTSQSERNLAIESVPDGQKLYHTHWFLDMFIFVSILLNMWLDVIMVS